MRHSFPPSPDGQQSSSLAVVVVLQIANVQTKLLHCLQAGVDVVVIILSSGGSALRFLHAYRAHLNASKLLLMP